MRRLIGSQIAVFVIATSLTPANASSNFEATESVIISTSEVNIKTEGHIQYPLETVKVNQGFFFFHPGVDLEGKTGEPVRPVMAGTVVAIQHSGFAYGNAILIRHGDSFSSLYAHLSKILVSEDQKVDLNTVIGEVGSTGRSSGDHLHLEIRENGRPTNPLSMLPKL